MSAVRTDGASSSSAYQPGDGSGPNDLSKDTVFSILRNPRRRHVLEVLKREGGASDVRTLTEEVAALENDVEPSELRYRQRKAVYTSLYQTHLDKLDDAGIVEYDKRSGEVSLTDAVAICDAYLNLDVDEDEETTEHRQWRPLTLALFGLNLVLAGVLVAVASTSVVAGAAVGVVGTVVIAYGAHQWYTGLSDARVDSRDAEGEHRHIEGEQRDAEGV